MSEAEELKTFRRADSGIQNFPNGKKVCKFKFCKQKKKCGNKFLRQKCTRSKTIRPRKLKSSHHVDLMRST